MNFPVTPLIRRMAERIEQEIREGYFREHQPMPSHRIMCEKHGVSVNTLRHALDLLEAKGLLYRRERSGTFVSPQAFVKRPSEKQPALRCVTIIEKEQPAARAGLRTDYYAGYTDALENLDIKTRFAVWSESATQPGTYLSDRFSRQEQGCILVNVAPPDLLHALRRDSIPFVVQFFCYYPAEGLPEHNLVYVNKVAGAFEATRYLMDMGHHRVALAGRQPVAGELPGIYEGYRSALLCSGKAPLPRDILGFLTDETELAMEPVRAWMKQPDLPTAILAQTDGLALTVLAVAEELGLKVPRNLSVVGFNDLPEAARSRPPLTTVASPRRQLGCEAMTMLLRNASKPSGPFEKRVLNCSLIIRESAGPATRYPVQGQDKRKPVVVSEADQQKSAASPA
jgi:LacI family transcriptional regulator